MRRDGAIYYPSSPRGDFKEQRVAQLMATIP